MNIHIDDILEFVFDDSFEKSKPELAKKIQEEEMYRLLVNEIQILREKHQSLEKVKEELLRRTKEARAQISIILSNNKNTTF